jgi:GNAT superfamily N-acetyltransferase
MISYHKESLCDVIAEVEPLLRLHYDELTLNKDRVKLDPDWERYANLEHAGGFHVLTARDGDRLVGYSAFFLNTHIHYRDLRVANNDVLYLHPECRKGMTGIRLIKFSEGWMKALGADKITWHAKYSNDLKQILVRLGYADEEAIMGKML